MYKKVEALSQIKENLKEDKIPIFENLMKIESVSYLLSDHEPELKLDLIISGDVAFICKRILENSFKVLAAYQVSDIDKDKPAKDYDYFWEFTLHKGNLQLLDIKELFPDAKERVFVCDEGDFLYMKGNIYKIKENIFYEIPLIYKLNLIINEKSEFDVWTTPSAYDIFEKNINQYGSGHKAILGFITDLYEQKLISKEEFIYNLSKIFEEIR